MAATCSTRCASASWASRTTASAAGEPRRFARGPDGAALLRGPACRAVPLRAPGPGAGAGVAAELHRRGLLRRGRLLRPVRLRPRLELPGRRRTDGDGDARLPGRSRGPRLSRLSADLPPVRAAHGAGVGDGQRLEARRREAHGGRGGHAGAGAGVGASAGAVLESPRLVRGGGGVLLCRLPPARAVAAHAASLPAARVDGCHLGAGAGAAGALRRAAAGWAGHAGRALGRAVAVGDEVHPTGAAAGVPLRGSWCTGWRVGEGGSAGGCHARWWCTWGRRATRCTCSSTRRARRP